MKLILQYKQKGDKPEVLFSSNNNQDVRDAFEAEKENGSFSTEIWSLGMREKAYYGEKKIVKKPVAKKAKKAKSSNSEGVED